MRAGIHQVDEPGSGQQQGQGGDGRHHEEGDAGKVIFPAPFTESILEFIRRSGWLPPAGIIIDPFAGTGRVHQLQTPTLTTIGVEIEPEWAALHPNTVEGNALALPWGDESFDGAVTSPVYGNRMSDSHRAKDGSLRRSYTHDLQRMTGDPERQLHADNAGRLYAWNKEYWRFHARAWCELYRVLKPGAPFILNVSDFIRTTRSHGQKRIPVVHTHTRTLKEIGFNLVAGQTTETPRMRYGENADLRVSFEWVLLFRKPR